MKTVYLLPLGIQEVQYSFNKEDFERTLQIKDLPNYSILSAQIEDDVAEKLQVPALIDLQIFNKEVPHSYYEKAKNFVENPPEWFAEDGMRLYVIFNNRRECFWSPSGNNLNSFYDKNPEYYLTKAIRVEFDKESYINIYAHFDFWCDSF